MIKVIGVWEIGWNAPMQECDMWVFPLGDFGVDEFCMTPVSGIGNPNVVERKDIQEYMDENPNLVPVYVDEKGTTNLADFKHPENVLYILGKSGYSPWIATKQQGTSLKIETVTNAGVLWAHQAITVVLYDRMLKSWQ